MSKQLSFSYNIDKITELENERRYKTRRYNKLNNDRERLKNIRKKNLNKIENMNREGNWNNNKNILSNELRESKIETRKLYYENLEKKKDLINKHENVVLLNKKIRNMEKLLDLKKKEIGHEEIPEIEEGNNIENLDDKVKEATQAMESEEKKTQIAIQRQKSEINNLKHQVEIAALKLREKHQESRL